VELFVVVEVHTFFAQANYVLAFEDAVDDLCFVRFEVVLGPLVGIQGGDFVEDTQLDVL